MIKTTLAYIVCDGHVLFLERNKREKDIHKGKFVVPGGKFLPGETPLECMIREVKEETGLEVEESALMGEIHFPEFNAGEDFYCYIYRVHQFSGILKENEEGFLHWIARENIQSLPQWEGDRIFLPWVLDGVRPFFAAFPYIEGKLKEYTVRW
ncbi:MAG: 8-oxo-dGTP diphosphatase [Tissierellia bacterium]|nr:8-oxo-dGTP diphosphatase [Bacillota bacterium]NLL22926.1 8-oxo-dGTP diphosphatase [Tissierellia bacterium]